MCRVLQFLASLPVLTILLTGCKHADNVLVPALPAATQTGRHTFGCNVNGTIWLPYVDHSLVDRAIETEYSPTAISVRVERETGNTPYIYFQIGDSTGIKEQTYLVRNGFHAVVTVATRDSLYSDELSTSDSDLVGSITVTKIKQPGGTINAPGIISGTFSFRARSYGARREVDVTDGRFDFALR